MYILGIESSCDETACSILNKNGDIIAETLFSQIDIHKKFGGVVPELASRDHASRIDSIVREAIEKANINLNDISAIAISNGPGLLGCLLVGLSYAKTLAMTLKIPLIPVDHVQAHLFTAFMDDHDVKLPLLGLVVSGGHTSIYLIKTLNDIDELAKTVDDAAGECFDKVARYVGLPYPGGKELSLIAQGGNPTINFPKPKLQDNNFSFSGLKTSVINYLHKYKITKESPKLPDILASFEETIVSILVDKLEDLALKHSAKTISIAGGVASNSRLRKHVQAMAKRHNIDIIIPPIKYCTDNAVMVANYARLKPNTEKTFTKEMLRLSAYPTFKRRQNV